MTNLDSARRAWRRLAVLPLLALFAGALAACASVEPMGYTPIDEIPPGRGAFSGEDGVFTLYNSSRRTEQSEDDEEGSEP